MSASDLRALYRAIGIENALREQAREELRAELAARKPPTARMANPAAAVPVGAPASLPGKESEFHRLVRALRRQNASAAEIAELLGYTERHIRRVLEQMGLKGPNVQIPTELRARCEVLRQRRSLRQG
jgi:transcriptional regulator with GAF, ATPase, and Fis domain